MESQYYALSEKIKDLTATQTQAQSKVIEQELLFQDINSLDESSSLFSAKAGFLISKTKQEATAEITSRINFLKEKYKTIDSELIKNRQQLQLLVSNLKSGEQNK